MPDNIDFKKFNSDPRIIENYDLLKETGILDEIDNLNNDIRTLNELLEEAVVIFNKFSIDDLINYVSKKMLTKFIPTYLAFIIEKEDSINGVNIICFKNMQRIESMIKIDSLDQYKKFFVLSPASIKFNAFVNMVENKEITDNLIPLEPELIVPMMGLDGMYGFLVFGKKVIDKDYSRQELEYIDKIMKFSSISLQNIIHYRRATIDSKTKLYNHSFFMRKLDEELSRIKRYNSKIAILMLDIDFFKVFNDTYGHLTGDKMLYNLSKIIIENIRKEDIAARFGGEEFVIMLIEADDSGAFQAAEKLRNIVQNFKLNYLKDKLSITISIGISTAAKDDLVDANELIRKADTALYTSKKNGRNKSTIYKKELEIAHND